MKISMKNVLTFVLILSLLALAACQASIPTKNEQSSGGSSGSKVKAGPKTMYLGLVNPPTVFNPINTGDVASKFIMYYMFDTLLDMDKPLHFVPKLADSFETKDNQTFTIKLNPKAKWTDGTPVTADDLIFTLNLAANPKVETVLGVYLSTLDGINEKGKLPEGETEIPSVKKIDEGTVQIKSKQPVDPNMIKEQLGLGVMILPKHVLKDVPPEKLSQDPFMMKPTVTSGPFKFVTYKKDQYVQFKANTDYHRGAPKLDEIFLKLMPAPNLVAQLQTGEIQMNVAYGIGDIPVQDYETVRKFSNVRIKEEPRIGTQAMLFNTKAITDSKVRQALVYALDRELMVNKLLKGSGEIVDGPYTSLSPYLDKDLEMFKHDPEKAKKMLTEAGWDFNRTLQLVVPIGNKVREESANIIAQNLQDVGVKVKITTYDFPTMLQKAKSGEYDLLLMGWSALLDPDKSNNYSSNGPYNFMGYKNPKVDELLIRGQSEPNSDKRHEIYNQFQEILHNDMPSITLYSDFQFAAISKDVAVGEPKVFGMLNNLHEWDLVGAK